MCTCLLYAKKVCIMLLCNMSDMPLPDQNKIVAKSELNVSRCSSPGILGTTVCPLQECSTSQAHVQSSHAGYAPSSGFCQYTSHLMALQAGKVSRDGMLANIHFFRVRHYTEQASMVLRVTQRCMLIHDMLPAPAMGQMLAAVAGQCYLQTSAFLSRMPGSQCNVRCSWL